MAVDATSTVPINMGRSESATESTANLNQIEPAPAPQAAASGAAVPNDPLWNHTLSTWATDIALVLLLALVFAMLTWWRLAKMGPAKRR